MAIYGLIYGGFIVDCSYGWLKLVKLASICNGNIHLAGFEDPQIELVRIISSLHQPQVRERSFQPNGPTISFFLQLIFPLPSWQCFHPDKFWKWQTKIPIENIKCSKNSWIGCSTKLQQITTGYIQFISITVNYDNHPLKTLWNPMGIVTRF